MGKSALPNLMCSILLWLANTGGIASLVLGCDTPEQLRESVALVNAPKINPEVAREAIKIAEEVDPVVIRPWE